MGNGKFHLYLDECSYKDKDRNDIYGICGVIVEDSTLTNVRTSLGELKKEIWKDRMPYREAKNIILHATEIRQAKNGSVKREHYEIFAIRKKVKLAFEGVAMIIENHNLPILGCVANHGNTSLKYNIKMNNYRSDALCMNYIMDNYACFLKAHNGEGDIIFESRYDHKDSVADKKLKKQFFKRMVYGTIHYQGIELQECISNISFRKKQENEAGLQLADFVVQPFLINYSKGEQVKPSIFKTIRKNRYSGYKELGGIDSNIHGVVYLR